MTGIIEDLRFAFRSLAKTPGFAVVVVLTFAWRCDMSDRVDLTVTDLDSLTPLHSRPVEVTVRSEQFLISHE